MENMGNSEHDGHFDLANLWANRVSVARRSEKNEASDPEP